MTLGDWFFIVMNLIMIGCVVFTYKKIIMRFIRFTKLSRNKSALIMSKGNYKRDFYVSMVILVVAIGFILAEIFYTGIHASLSNMYMFWFLPISMEPSYSGKVFIFFETNAFVHYDNNMIEYKDIEKVKIVAFRKTKRRNKVILRILIKEAKNSSAITRKINFIHVKLTELDSILEILRRNDVVIENRNTGIII